MLTPIAANNDMANIASQLRDLNGQQQPLGAEVAAPAESERPTPAANPGAAPNNEPQLSAGGQRAAAVAPETTTLQTQADAQQALSSVRESLYSNPSQALIAQGEVQRDPAAALLGTSPSA
ncbi:MAG: hypothetical protein H7842_01550 [Gammaproteobacteria bacterium SHHR-1]|uniref:hypothetical protein n=1 Tax=Magnetovirga frankeli TaxID=947516 RepID=UPI0012937945|nr:hypothetical protein D5125_05070 [gamma proteobacterium SS-5]